MDHLLGGQTSDFITGSMRASTSAVGDFSLHYDEETTVHKIDVGGEDQALRFVDQRHSTGPTDALVGWQSLSREQLITPHME